MLSRRLGPYLDDVVKKATPRAGGFRTGDDEGAIWQGPFADECTDTLQQRQHTLNSMGTALLKDFGASGNRDDLEKVSGGLDGLTAAELDAFMIKASPKDLAFYTVFAQPSVHGRIQVSCEGRPPDGLTAGDAVEITGDMWRGAEVDYRTRVVLERAADAVEEETSVQAGE
ncbi:hypothetical protein ACFPZI_05000 [Streptomyces chlorus]|uniref:Uncharacterized protein n=1 Tax=Streptomyces chlorus TaxID=887452 RepID=A0ABW1DS57_9ACTN